MSHHVLAFGRMNPVTSGHEAVVNKIHSVAKEHNAGHTLVVSHSQDKKKNPLSADQKVKYAKAAFKNTNVKAASKDKPTIMHHAADLHKQGVEHLHVVAGSDRTDEYHKLLHKYNGQHSAHGHYNFKSITVHSSGERDPDAEGTSGMSASKMREHAANGNEKEFHKGAPSTMSTANKKAMYKDVRKGMDINEGRLTYKELIEGKMSGADKFRKHLDNLAKKRKEGEAERAKLPDNERLKATVDALEKSLMRKEEVELEEARGSADKHWSIAQDHKEKASLATKGSEKYHTHMADHHDSMSRYHEELGQSNHAAAHADKAEIHHEKAYQASKSIKEAHKIGDQVLIHKGPRDVVGKVGRIGEIRKPWVGAQPRYTIDHDEGSIQLMAHHIKKHKPEVKEEYEGSAADEKQDKQGEEHIHTKIEHNSDHKLITHGPDFSMKVGKEHHSKINGLNHGEQHAFKCMDGKDYGVEKRGDRLHFAAHPGDSGQMASMNFHIHADEFAGKDAPETKSKTPDITKLSSYAQMLGRKALSHPELLSPMEKAHMDAINSMTEETILESAPFKDLKSAVHYASEKVKTHRDHDDGIEVYKHKAGGYDVNHTMNANGRNALRSSGAKHLGTVYRDKSFNVHHNIKEEIETLDEKNWIAGAIKHPGALTRAAKRAGETTSEYEQKHKHDSGKTGARARLALTLKKMHKEQTEQVDEVLNPSMGAGKYIKDFQKSDAPQFKGKSKEKRRMMGIAAYLQAQREMQEARQFGSYEQAKAAAAPGQKPKLNPATNKYILVSEETIQEATVETKKYSWGTMKTVHHGADFSIPLHPEHHEAIAKLKDEQEHHFKDETGRHWTARRKGDDVHFQGANGGNSTKVKHSTMSEELVGGQKKLDKNHNGKLDSQDFKILRAKKKVSEEVEQLEEANHREFASQGKMHPDMAKHMTVGDHMDYYEPKTGDKVHGKVMHNNGKEVHIKQTHDSYNPKKVGSVHKFKVSNKLDEEIKQTGPVDTNKVNAAGDKPHDEKWEKAKKVKKESLTFADFINTLKEHQYSSGSYKHKGTYGSSHVEPDDEDEEKPAKPAAEKRGRGRPKGSSSGARQVGSTAAKKKTYADYTGYKLHLPNTNK